MTFDNLPELNFVDTDIEKMLSDAKTVVEGILGRTVARADPLMLFVKSLLVIIYQQRLLIDTVAKDNLLFYSTGDALEHLGALVGVYRLPATKAAVTCQLTLSAPISRAITIRQGTRVTAGDNINFAMDDDLTFLAGQTELTAKFTCTEEGELGNGYAPGELSVIVDPQSFLAVIKNITTSEGGADIESDDNLRERIRIAPESFSSAGPTGAYEFFVKQASSLIEDVFIDSENPGEVDIYPLLKNGELPGAEILSLIDDVVNDREIRPLTDQVFIKIPETVDYDIDLIYWISRDDSAIAAKIQNQVEAAVQDFILWQKSKLGRDLNKTELEFKIRAAGAKRVEINYPSFAVIPDNAIAVCQNVSVAYAGLEKA